MYRRIALLGFLLTAAAGAAPIFNFVEQTAMTDEMRNGFTAAGQRWSALFADDVTITINIGFADLASGILGSTSTWVTDTPYLTAHALLGADRTSADDNTAYAHLQAGPLVALANYTQEHNGATAFKDDDVSRVTLTVANARALGFTFGEGTIDASITFNTDYNTRFDYNPGDGVGSAQYDFVGIASHEIGHALGFISQVDYRDYYPNQVSENGDPNYYPSVLDLYRYTSASVEQDALDWTVGGAAYFSIDGGDTSLSPFCTGRNRGNGCQASHWARGAPGLMDPDVARGQLLQITALDIQAMDAIGWDLAAPEPAGFLLAAPGLLGAILLRRRRQGGRLAG